MSPDHPSARWLKRVQRGKGPIYAGLAAALEEAISEGELQAGDQLPPQRAVAELLGVDFTTVTRAYATARDRGLVEGAVGRGTFVRARAADDEAGLVDLSMNLPPPPQGVSLAAMLRETTAAILARTDPATLMAYHPGAGTLGQKTAAAAWLAPCAGEIAPDRLLVCAGAQTGLTALLGLLTTPGDRLIVEPLTYPGLRACAARRGATLVPCPVDGEGFLIGELDRLCAESKPVAIYLIPTAQNPTAGTMGLTRRRQVAEIARAHDVWLIEDDPYSRLFEAPPPAMVSLAPERTFHLATLSKCLSPGLRTAFLATPGGAIGERVGQSLRDTALMAAPLMTAVVTSWIRDGAAEALLAGVRREARARRALAAEVLATARGAAESIHLWLDLPDSWAPDHLRQTAQRHGLSLVTADAFASGPEWPNGVRLSLGGPARQAVLRDALQTMAALLKGVDAPPRIVV